MPYDLRVKEISRDNVRLRKRTGELLVELNEAQNELAELKLSTSHIPKDGKVVAKTDAKFVGRPQTAQSRSKKADLVADTPTELDLDQEMADIDSELQ